MSANSTGWSLKKLPTISVLTPSESLRRVTPARRLFYHMTLLGAPLARLMQPLRRVGRPRELERRQGSNELGMGDTNVLVGSLEELVLVLPPEGLTTTAAAHAGNIDSHLAHRTADKGLIFLPSAPILGGVCVRELEVRRHLFEVPYELSACRSFEHGYEHAQGFDGEASLVEVTVLLGEPTVPQRRDRVERLDEEVRHLESLQLLFELLYQLVVRGWPGRLGQEGSHSSKRFPSRSPQTV